MTRWLSERPARFIAIIGCYFLVNLIVRLILPDSLELDEAQQSLVSQWLALGYDTQPPFYNWVQSGVIALFGNTVFSLAALKNLCLFATYVLYYLLSRRLLKSPALALAAAFGLLTVPQIAWESQRDLTHSVALNLLAVVFLFSFFSLIRQPRTRYYILAGVAAGFGLIAKYNFAMLVIAAGVALLASPAHRKRLFDPRILLSGAIAAAIVLPHALWLFDHLAAATDGTLSKLARASSQSQALRVLTGLGSIAAACVAFAALPTAIFVVVFGRDFWRSLRIRTDETRIMETMALMMIVILAAMVFVTGATSFKDRWLSPVLVLLPLYVMLKLEAGGIDGQRVLRRLLPVATVIMLLVPTALLVRTMTTVWTGSYQKINVPYGPFAARVLSEEGATPGLVVAADPHLAGNMRHQMPQSPVAAQWYPDAAPVTRWTGQTPLLLVWRSPGDAAPTLPPALIDWLDAHPGARSATLTPKTMDVPYLYGRGGDTYRFGYAWISKP